MFNYAEFEFVEWVTFDLGEVETEIPFVVYCEYEPPERDVGFAGGVTINDITLGGKSVFTQCEAIAEAIHDKLRKLEPYLSEKAHEVIAEKQKDEYAAYCDYQYDMLRDRKIERGAV